MNEIRQCDLSLPNLCILKCKMCNFWKNDLLFQDPSWLKIEDYRKLLYDLRDFAEKPLLVSFGGGEPLLIKYMLDIAAICRELGFNSYFPTNAYLIDEVMANKIAKAGIFSIGISLDSLDKKTHDFIRGREGCWERVMKAIGYLDKYCPDISINILTVIMGVNLGGIVDLTKWVYEHSGLHRIVFQAIQKPFNASCPENWYEFEEYADLWPRDTLRVNAVMDELIMLRKNNERGFKISNPVAQLELFRQYFNGPVGFVKPQRCHLGYDVIRVDCSGNVILCSEMDSIGNIKEDHIG